MSQLATSQDLADRAGSPVDNPAQADAILGTASHLVVAYLGQDPPQPTPEPITSVVVDVAYRVWSNPDGLVGDSVDDTSRRWSERLSTDGYYLTAANRAILDQYRASRSLGVGTLGVTRSDPVTGDSWVPTVGGPDFPWYATDVTVLP